MEIDIDGQITTYIRTGAHTRIQSLRVVKNDRTGTCQGLEPHHPTMGKVSPIRTRQGLEPHQPTIEKGPLSPETRHTHTLKSQFLLTKTIWKYSLV